MDYKKMKKAELIEECRKMGIPAEGTVDELRKRLQDEKDKTSLTDPDAQDIPYRLMDAEDDMIIEADLQGRLLEKYVYEIEVWDHETNKKKKIHELSATGIDNCCRASADKLGEVYRVIDLKEREDDDNYFASVKVGRYKISYDDNGNPHEILLDTSLGSKRQAKKYQKKGGGTGLDTFAYEKCIRKAERNGKRQLLPMTFILRMIEEYVKKGKVHTIRQPQPISEGIRQELIGLSGGYEQLKKIAMKVIGFDDTTKLTLLDSDRIKNHIKNQRKEVPEIPESINQLYESLEKLTGDSFAPTRREASWAKNYLKYKDEAEKKMTASLNKEINEARSRVEEGKI